MSDNPGVPPPVEIIPGIQGGISAIGSSHAPFLYFELAPAFAHLNGIIRVTLTAGRDMPVPDAPGLAHDHVVVAHLRMNIPAALALRDTLSAALLLAQQPPSAAKN
jgi:hypothetical protein